MYSSPPVWISLGYQRGRQLVQSVGYARPRSGDVQEHDISRLRGTPENSRQERRRHRPRICGVEDRLLAEDAGEDVRRRAAEQRAAGLGQVDIQELARNRGRDDVPEERNHRLQASVVAGRARRRCSVYRVRPVVVVLLLGSRSAVGGSRSAERRTATAAGNRGSPKGGSGMMVGGRGLMLRCDAIRR